jgi:hypothetical protein
MRRSETRRETIGWEERVMELPIVLAFVFGLIAFDVLTMRFDVDDRDTVSELPSTNPSHHR